MTLCRRLGRECEFRCRGLNNYPLSYREKLEVAKEQEKALQAFVDREMPHGYRYFDWDDENKYHKGLYIRQSTSNSTNPEHFASVTTAVPVLHPRACCTIEEPPPVLQASDTFVNPDHLSEAATLVESRTTIPASTWQPTDVDIVWLLNALYFLTFLLKRFGLLWFVTGSLLSFFLLLWCVWERIRPLPHGTSTFVPRRGNLWEQLVTRFGRGIQAFCALTAGEIRQ